MCANMKVAALVVITVSGVGSGVSVGGFTGAFWVATIVIMCLIIMAMQIRMSGLEFIAETVSNLKSPELRAFAAWLRQQPVTPRTAPLLSNLATLERVPEFAAARERIAVDIAFVQAAAAALTSH